MLAPCSWEAAATKHAEVYSWFYLSVTTHCLFLPEEKLENALAEVNSADLPF